MSRKSRIKSNSGDYHIIITGINHMDIFLEEEDKLFFQNKFIKYAKELKIKIFSFVIMDNHFHAEIGNATDEMSRLVQKLCTSYAMYYNRKYNRHGPLFNGRFKSEPINDMNYFYQVCRYINQNPEKAGISRAEKYKWSSFRFYRKKRCFLNTDFFIEQFGSVGNFIKFLKTDNEDYCMEYYNKETSIVSNDNLYSDFIRQLLNIKNPGAISNKNSFNMNSDLKLLLKCGLSISRISRLTGISIGKIAKLNKIQNFS